MTDAAILGQNLVADRRRAGRTQVDAVLLPLLRNPSTAGLLIEHDEHDMPEVTQFLARRGPSLFARPAADDLAPARSIVVSAGASIVLWGAIYAVGCMLWRLV